MTARSADGGRAVRVARGWDHRYRVVLTGALNDDSLSYDGTAKDAARIAVGPGRGQFRLGVRVCPVSGDVSHAEVEVVGS